MSADAVYGSASGGTLTRSDSMSWNGSPLRAVPSTTAMGDRPVKRQGTPVQARDLYAHAALGYGLSALAAGRAGRVLEADSDIHAARSLLELGRSDDPELAVRVRLAIARAAITIGDAAAARSALRRLPELLVHLPDAAGLWDEAECARNAAARLGVDAPIGAALLTPAETRVLQMLPSHRTFKEMGRDLYVSHNTVKTHAISVYRKLGVTSRSEAVHMSRRLGLIDE